MPLFGEKKPVMFPEVPKCSVTTCTYPALRQQVLPATEHLFIGLCDMHGRMVVYPTREQPAPKTCSMCGRHLDSFDDPLSGDCGGDCAYCMLKAEVDVEDLDTAFKIAANIAARALRLKERRVRD